MNFTAMILSIPLFLVVMIVFLPIANEIMAAMSGLFSPAVFVSLNALIVVVTFVGIYGILNNLISNQEEVANA